MSKRIFGGVVSVLGLLFILIGCAEVVRVGTTIGEGMGQISKEDKEKIDRLALQTEKAIRPMNEQEEYYVGRAVAATILGQYRLYRNERLTRYLNEVGQAVALASSRPFTYGGYHFAVLDTDEVNALACPGGIIFVTKGMLKKAQNEEEVAAILAHEIAHVSHKDGLGAIQSARWAEVVTALGDHLRELDGRFFPVVRAVVVCPFILIPVCCLEPVDGRFHVDQRIGESLTGFDLLHPDEAQGYLLPPLYVIIREHAELYAHVVT